MAYPVGIATATLGCSRRREAVAVTNAILGIDLADKKQMVVVTDHGSEMLTMPNYS